MKNAKHERAKVRNREKNSSFLLVIINDNFSMFVHELAEKLQKKRCRKKEYKLKSLALTAPNIVDKLNILQNNSLFL